VLLLASLGLYVLLQNTISLIYGDDLKSLLHGQALQGISIFHATITTVQLVTLGANAVLYATVGFLFARSRFGITIRGVADDPELALIVGVDRDHVMILVFALGSALAAIAGIFIGFDTSLSPTMGFRALLMGVVAAIIGGVGSIPGSILGGLFVGFLQNVGVWKLPTEWQDGVVFLALIVFLLVRPRGFLGKPLERTPI
jgi:branched-chain amino acid transport system permease protein